MIIYGSRMYGKRDLVHGYGQCEQCGRYGKNISYTGRKWGHIYFIPLIPAGGRVRVIKQCKACSQGIHLPEKELEQLRNKLRRSTEKALAALMEGETHFDDGGIQVSASDTLRDTVDLLHSVQADNHLRLLLAAMKEKQFNHVYQLASGASLEFKGKLDEAEEAYKQAALCKPDDATALVSLASVYTKKNEPEKAIQLYEKALGVNADPLAVRQALLNLYEVTKDFASMARTYEECFERVPELTRDKKIFKAYKKACKKAGKDPIAG